MANQPHLGTRVDGSLIEGILQAAIAAGDIAGAVAGVVLGNGARYTTAFGKQNVAQDHAMREDSIFRIASMIKPVIAVAALQLYDQGLFALDDPAADYLPAIAKLRVFDGFDDKGMPLLRPPASPITIRQLFTHTSGSAYDVLHAELRKYVESDFGGAPDGGPVYRTMPLVDDPGKRWHYGFSSNWLAEVVETLSGRELKAYFEDNLFEPLGMVDTYCVRMPAEKEPRLVTRHMRRSDGTLEEAPQEIWDPPYCGGSGLVTTAGDYMAFLQMILNRGLYGGHRLLRAETVDRMAENQMGELSVVKMKSAVPGFIDFELFPESGQRNKWGLGFHLNGDAIQGGRSRYSLSWAGRYNTYFWIDISRQVAAVLLLQTEPFAEPKALDLLRRFERAVYAAIR